MQRNLPADFATVVLVDLACVLSGRFEYFPRRLRNTFRLRSGAQNRQTLNASKGRRTVLGFGVGKKVFVHSLELVNVVDFPYLVRRFTVGLSRKFIRICVEWHRFYKYVSVSVQV
jgi:hypothetical protein